MTTTSHPPPDARSAVLAVLARHVDEPGALLPILHDVQAILGYIPKPLVPEIANALNLSLAEVHGVVSYYHDFRDEPAAGQVIRICRAESCQAMGAEALLAHAQRQLGCALHGPSSDGAFTVEPVYCLGLCASSPALTLNDEPHARVTPAVFDALVAQARSAA